MRILGLMKATKESEAGVPPSRDGPFTESKELVASYALMQVKDMDEAVMWCTRFLGVLGEGECELRPIFEPDGFSPDVFTPEEAAREAATRAQMERNARR